MKVETHNHPTAISPFPGAATGSGGEIRDEGATGRGAKPKAGLAGFSVSHLRIPGQVEPWESFGSRWQARSHRLRARHHDRGPDRRAAFNNEFGRPNIAGYFRTYEQRDAGDAGALGLPQADHDRGRARQHPRGPRREEATAGGSALVIVLGGPAMLIGLGGGAASSVGAGASTPRPRLRFRTARQPEMQRRAQEVIDRCWALGDDNPILLDPRRRRGRAVERAAGSRGAQRARRAIDLRAIPSDEPGMSPLEIWCNESQERYVLGGAANRYSRRSRRCALRERCPFAVVGTLTEQDGGQLSSRPLLQDEPVDMPLGVLLGKPPKMLRDVKSPRPRAAAFDTAASPCGCGSSACCGSRPSPTRLS
jgi:phosphoribosylformylglycinamidine synthase